jgi:hypothetical protein
VLAGVGFLPDKLLQFASAQACFSCVEKQRENFELKVELVPDVLFGIGV